MAKAQSSIEFFTVYGFVLLALVVLLGSLFYLGVFDLNSLRGQSKRGFVNLVPLDWALNSDGEFSLFLKNNAGTRVYVDNVTVSLDQRTGFASTSTVFSVGGIGLINSTGMPSRAYNDFYELNLVIRFTDLETGLSFTESGFLTGRVSGNVLPTVTPTPMPTVTPTPTPTVTPTPTPTATPIPTPTPTPLPVINAMVSYFDSTSPSVPKHVEFNSSGWSAGESMLDVSSEARWHKLEWNPVRNESVSVVQTSLGNIVAQVWNGSEWGNAITLSIAGASSQSYRSFDLAYESNGNAVVVYKASNNAPRYRIWNGVSWSSEFNTGGLSPTVLSWITLEAKPNSNNLSLLFLGSSNGLYYQEFDGVSWTTQTLLESNSPSSLYESFGMSFESQSGDLLIVYSEGTITTPRYRIYSGGVMSSELTAPSVGGRPYWYVLASEENSDRIILGSLDNGRDLNSIVWSGSSWGAMQELNNNLESYSYRVFDLVFQTPVQQALLVYGKRNSNIPAYRTWTNAGGWSAESSAITASGRLEWIALSKGSNNEVFLALADTSLRVSVQKWSGASWSDYAQLTSLVTYYHTQCFDIAARAS
ncbi:MAG: hypothetical protein ABH803_00040 [Candidatus Micrarchaeota archaeon]